MVHGAALAAAKLLIQARVGALAFSTYRNPWRAIQALRLFGAERARLRSGRVTTKFVKTGRRLFWNLYVPGWPGRSFDRFVRAEFERLLPRRTTAPPLHALVLAITRKCGLRCEHCCEGDSLNQPDALSLDQLLRIVARFRELGVVQVFLSGGEPLARFDDLVALLDASPRDVDYWLLTSGHGLTLERAVRLRQAGLTGIALGLDHHDPVLHDRFRGVEGTFAWVKAAAANAHAARLGLCLSLCATKEFVSDANLTSYARTARELGVGFIQILEPRAIGRYAGRDVGLGDEQIRLLDQFYLSLNFDPANRRMPSITYLARAKRHSGTHCGGNRSVYVNSSGRLHPCPFCRADAGSALSDPLGPALASLRRAGCRGVAR
jgi:MoaA/NifB/PqqE/SkfB family radical SAM enzyme